MRKCIIWTIQAQRLILANWWCTSWSFPAFGPFHSLPHTFIHLTQSFIGFLSTCCSPSQSPIISLKGGPFGKPLKGLVSSLIVFRPIWIHKIWRLPERPLEIGSSSLPLPLLWMPRGLSAKEGAGKMSPARLWMSSFKLPVDAWDGALTASACLSTWSLFLPFSFSFFVTQFLGS